MSRSHKTGPPPECAQQLLDRFDALDVLEDKKMLKCTTLIEDMISYTSSLAT